MPQILDLSGLACPLPVIRTKEALESQDSQELIVMVDNDAARDNVARFAESRGCSVTITPVGQCYHVTIKPLGGEPAQACVSPAAGTASPIRVVVFASDRMGEGDPALGDMLVRAFCESLMQLQLPRKLLFYNRGVFLTLDDSQVLHELKELEDMGVELLICGTCLDFYQVRERLSVGRVSNMFTILETQMQATCIIRP